jgi:hypothetical protein
MLASLVDALFGCAHKRYSFPITARRGQRSPAASVTGTYVVCLDCGREFPYDWSEMKVVSASRGTRSGAIAKAIESYVGK